MTERVFMKLEMHHGGYGTVYDIEVDPESGDYRVGENIMYKFNKQPDPLMVIRMIKAVSEKKEPTGLNKPS